MSEEIITVDKAFRIMNSFLSHPCIDYARRVKRVLSQIKQFTDYYYILLKENKNLSNSQKGLIKTFLLEYQQIVRLLNLYTKEMEMAEKKVFSICYNNTVYQQNLI